MKRHGLIQFFVAALAMTAAAAWAQTDAPDTTTPTADSQLDNTYHIIPNEDAKPGDSAYSRALHQAIADYQAGRLNQAMTQLLALEKQAPGDATVHSILGYIDLKQNKPADAITEMQTVVKLVPRDPGAHKNLGRAYLQTGDYPNAAAQFRSVLGVSPLDTDAQFGLALALGHTGQYEESAAGFRKVVAAKPSAAAYQDLGVVLQQSGHYAEAADAFQHASALDSTHAANFLDAGLLYAQTGDDDKAIVALNQALALGTTDPYHAHLALAQAYSHSRSSGKAIQEFTAASEINANDPTVFYNLGVLNQQGGQTAAAETAYRKALDLKPTDPKLLLNAQTNLGLLLANDGNADEAKPLLTAAAQADPTAAVPRAALGSLSARQGDTTEAIAEWRTALTLDPSDNQTRLLLADALLAQKKYADAAEQYSAVANADPDNTAVQNALGTAYEELGQTINARAAFLAAVGGHGTAKERAQAQNNLGVVYEKQGRKALAIAAYKKAAVLDPTLMEARRNLARFAVKR